MIEEMPKKKAKVISYDLHSSLKLGMARGEEAAATGSNFVFSPLSIRAALGLLAAAGMLGPENMRSLLSLLGSTSLEDVNTASASLLHACRPSDDESVMKISLANGIWVKESRDFEPSDTVKSIFKTSVNRVDFKTKANEVRTEINDWIEKETVGLIKDFLPQDIPNEGTLYLLGNALYFKGNWEHGFNSWEIKVRDFRLHDTITRVKVPFMTRDSYELFSAYEGFKVLMLPYKKNSQKERNLSLIIYLPDKKDGLIDLLDKVASNPDFIDSHLPEEEEFVYIQIPKFTISSKFEASDYLMKMGLNIAHMIHGATIEVDEKGTIAAAATVCDEEEAGGTDDVFVADHPFLYAIREGASGAILFLGHVVNPSMH